MLPEVYHWNKIEQDNGENYVFRSSCYDIQCPHECYMDVNTDSIRKLKTSPHIMITQKDRALHEIEWEHYKSMLPRLYGDYNLLHDEPLCPINDVPLNCIPDDYLAPPQWWIENKEPNNSVMASHFSSANLSRRISGRGIFLSSFEYEGDSSG